MADLEALLSNATVIRIQPGDHLFIANTGFHDGDWERAGPELDALKAACGASRIWLFVNDIDVKAIPAETLAQELLAMAERDPEVGKALEEAIGRRNRINGQEVL